MAHLLFILAACNNTSPSALEGDDPGECSDLADNDANGLFDCADPACDQAPECQGEAADSSPTCDTHTDCDPAGGLVCLDGVCVDDPDFTPGASPDAWSIPDGYGANSDSKSPGAPIGEFCGITAYQNGSDPMGNAGAYDGTYGIEYQCTEYAFRFVCQTYGLCSSKEGLYGNAHQWYANERENGVLAQLTALPNDGTTAPQPGDVLVLGTGYAATTGHVAVVSAVEPDGSGAYVVRVTEQNCYNCAHAHVMTENGGRYHIDDALGWLRYPDAQDHLCDEALEVSCEGTIESASVSEGELRVKGWIECDSAVDKWSLVVDSTTEHSDWPGSPTVSFDERIDVSDYSGGSHSLGLLVRPEGHDEGILMDSTWIEVQVDEECVDQGTTECISGDVWSVDSCGEALSREELCGAEESCVEDGDSASCEAGPCVDEATTACYAGDVYYYDSCGDRGSRAESCASDETCVETGSSAVCDPNCGNGSVDSGEDCDGSDLDGETCEDLGWDYGSLSCTSSCSFDESACGSCVSASYSQCYAGDVYYYDSCGSRGSKKEECGSTSGCENASSSAAECTAEAIDTTSTPTSCGSTSRDIFTATSVSSISDADSDPSVTVTWEKCDGSSFSSSKSCHVRVGSHSSSGVVRTSKTVSKGSSSWDTTFDIWPSASDFDGDSCGATKELYFTCDDGSSTAYWYGATPVEFEKDCP